MRAFCEQLPKGGMLHVHPWGSISRLGVEHLFSVVNPTILPRRLHAQYASPGAAGSLYPEELAFLLDLHQRYGEKVAYASLRENDRYRLRELLFLTSGTHPFSRFESIFHLMRDWFQTNPAIDAERLVQEDIFPRAKAQRVDYLEISNSIRPTPEWVRSLENWARGVESQYGLTVRWLASFARGNSPDVMKERAFQLLALPTSPVLLGVNLVADETFAPALEQGQMLYLPVQSAVTAGTSSLRRTMHAGELGDPRNVRDALLLGSERIGHGVNLIHDRVTLELARRQKTPVEVNLTSNLRLRVVEDLKSHPFLYFLRLGLRVSLSTDDEGILGTDINNECVTAITYSDLNYKELRDMSLNSLETAFAPHAIIDPLRKKLLADLAAFESAWQPSL